MSKRLSNNNRYGDRKLKLSRLEPERLLLVMKEPSSASPGLADQHLEGRGPSASYQLDR